MMYFERDTLVKEVVGQEEEGRLSEVQCCLPPHLLTRASLTACVHALN